MSQVQSTSQIQEWNKRFGVPGVIHIEPGSGLLPRIFINSPLASAEVYLHGAHVTHFQPQGQTPVLFMSRSSMFEANKPIRGGVPLIFPWFGGRAGHPESPAHGLARLRSWQIESCATRSDGSVRIDLLLASDDATLSTWPYAFELRMQITIARELEMTLEVRNQSQTMMQFEDAMHTYFSVGDVQRTTVEGLDNIEYLDKVDGMKRKRQEPGAISFTGETDRVYFNTQTPILIKDPVLGRTITVTKQESNATVVWNPWVAKARAMPDFGDTEWPQMLCIETANALENAVKLEPGKVHRMHTGISVSA